MGENLKFVKGNLFLETSFAKWLLEGFFWAHLIELKIAETGVSWTQVPRKQWRLELSVLATW